MKLLRGQAAVSPALERGALERPESRGSPVSLGSGRRVPGARAAEERGCVMLPGPAGFWPFPSEQGVQCCMFAMARGAPGRAPANRPLLTRCCRRVSRCPARSACLAPAAAPRAGAWGLLTPLLFVPAAGVGAGPAAGGGSGPVQVKDSPLLLQQIEALQLSIKHLKNENNRLKVRWGQRLVLRHRAQPGAGGRTGLAWPRGAGCCRTGHLAAGDVLPPAPPSICPARGGFPWGRRSCCTEGSSARRALWGAQPGRERAGLAAPGAGVSLPGSAPPQRDQGAG